MSMIFFTTSTLSDVQETQSKCINKLFPDCEYIVIDGRTGWFSVWYEWLNIAKTKSADWYIHVDEDCFITSRKEIELLISEMLEKGYDISGCADGQHTYRGANHAALNSFFMIMNRKCIDSWHNRTHVPQFKEEYAIDYPYSLIHPPRYEFNMEFGSSGKPFHEIYIDGTEPYYDFMWVLKEANMKFNYLKPNFGEDFQTTNLLNDTIFHMWHQRERFVNAIVSTVHKYPNVMRFNLMLEYLQKTILMERGLLNE